jgi:hypothetical protein
MAEQICNFDETNVDFDPATCSTLCKIGKRTVSLWVNGHSGRCTIMLGFTASGVKVPCIHHMEGCSRWPHTPRLSTKCVSWGQRLHGAT